MHPRRRARPRPAGAAGRTRRAAAHRPAASWCARPTPTLAAACWTGGSSTRDGDRLVVRGRATRRTSTALLVAGRRRGSRELVARAAHARGGRASKSVDRSPRQSGPGGRRDRRRTRQAAAPAAHVAHASLLLNLLPTIVAVLLAVTARRHRGPGRARRSSPRCWPTVRCSPRRRSAIVLPLFLPDRGRRRRRRLRSPARRRPARCAICWCARSGRTRLLVAKLVVGVRVRPDRGRAGRRRSAFIVGTLLLGNEPTRAGADRSACPARRSPPEQIAWRTLLVDRLRRRCRCSASRRWRCSCRRSPTRRCGAALGALAFLIGSSLLLTARRGPRRSSRTCRRATGWRSSTCSATRSCGATSSAACCCKLVYVVVLLGAAWANFATKDIKS